MARRPSILTVTREGDQLKSLTALSEKLASEIDGAEARELPALARQYRETLRAISELGGGDSGDDEITTIICRRTNGKPAPDSVSRT